MIEISGKWALITGSSRGIGQQIALGLAKRGVNVVVHGRTSQGCEATRKLLAPFDVHVAIVGAPLDTEAGARQVVEQTLAATDGRGVDFLFSNAGVQNQWKSVWDISIAEWKTLFQINLFSVVAINNGLIPPMVDRGFGRIIMTSSGIPDIPQLTPYGCSKHAIDKYAFDLAAELKDTGVRINAMDPGWIRTDLGGPNGMFAVDAVLPGALIPLITDDVIPSGTLYRAQDYRGL